MTSLPSAIARCDFPTPGGPSNSNASPFATQRAVASSLICCGSILGCASKALSRPLALPSPAMVRCSGRSPASLSRRLPVAPSSSSASGSIRHCRRSSVACSRSPPSPGPFLRSARTAPDQSPTHSRGRTMRRHIPRAMLALIMTLALICCGYFGAGKCRRPAVVGTDLVGARGVTPADQRKIDRTVVDLCAGGVWTNAECIRHGEGR